MAQLSSIIVYVLVSYFIGSISPASIIGGVKGVDLSREGTGNPGAANVFQVIGPGWGILTGLLDFFKGVIPVVLCGYLGFSQGVVILAALAVISGHNWPLFSRFRGGRGLAATMGTMAVMAFLPAFLAFITGGALAWIIRESCRRLIRVAFLVYPLFLILLLFFSAGRELLFYAAGIMIIAWIRALQLQRAEGASK